MSSTVNGHRPWSYQVELVQGCNRRCAMCGIHALPDSDLHLMEPLVAEIIADDLATLSPNARVEFAMHGEPLLHPEWRQCIRAFRQAFPRSQLQMTTNGMPLRGAFAGYADAWRGLLNVVIIDLYQPYGPCLREEIMQWGGKRQGWRVVDFYTEQYIPWHNHGSRERTIVLMDDLLGRDGERPQRVIMNHAGNGRMGRQLLQPLEKVCTLPYREMAVRHDGRVGICCMDWGLEYQVGDVLASGAKAVWWGEAWQAARRILASRRRWLAPCCRCDAPSGMRVGLLPSMVPPDDACLRLAQQVNRESPRINGRAPEWRGP